MELPAPKFSNVPAEELSRLTPLAYFKEKLRDLVIHVCTIFFDIALAGVWLIGEYCLEHFLVPLFKVDSFVSNVSLWIIRVLFAVSTLVPCVSKILKHVRIVWIRDRIEARKETAASAGGSTEG